MKDYIIYIIGLVSGALLFYAVQVIYYLILGKFKELKD